jgi:hypothetical protein
MCTDKPVVIVLDALDECPLDENIRKKVLICIQDTIKSASVQLLVTSRPEHDIKMAFDKCASQIAAIEIAGDLINGDIQAVICSYVYDPEGGLGRWRHRPKVQRKIVTNLKEKSDGM